jgi:hypothetical protein
VTLAQVNMHQLRGAFDHTSGRNRNPAFGRRGVSVVFGEAGAVQEKLRRWATERGAGAS